MLLKIYTILNGVKKTAEAYIFTASHNTKTRQISVKLGAVEYGAVGGKRREFFD